MNFPTTTEEFLFLSTPSARRATQRFLIPFFSADNFYPRPPRGGRRRTSRMQKSQTNFYPRPPRGGRPRPQGRRPADQPISIHALREEGDLSLADEIAAAYEFLSTPSARRATPLAAH